MIIVYDDCYCDKHDIDDVLGQFEAVEFIQGDCYKGVGFDLSLTDRVSVVGDKADVYNLANDKVAFCERYKDISPLTLERFVEKPSRGRDSIGVKVSSKGVIAQEYLEGNEYVVCVYVKGGVVRTMTAQVVLSEEILSEEVKLANNEVLIAGVAGIEERLIDIFEELELDRMVRFDVRGGKVLELNLLGGIGRTGLMYRAFEVNGVGYKEYLKTVFSQKGISDEG